MRRGATGAEPTQKKFERQSWQYANEVESAPAGVISVNPALAMSDKITRLERACPAGTGVRSRPHRRARLESGRAACRVHRADRPVRGRPGHPVVHVQPHRAALLHAAAAGRDPAASRRGSSTGSPASARSAACRCAAWSGRRRARHLEPRRRSRAVHPADPRRARSRAAALRLRLRRRRLSELDQARICRS